MALIKLTEVSFDEYGAIKKTSILIGTEQIITVKPIVLKNHKNSSTINCTEIRSRDAMVITSFVLQTVDKIKELELAEKAINER